MNFSEDEEIALRNSMEILSDMLDGKNVQNIIDDRGLTEEQLKENIKALQNIESDIQRI